MFSKAINKNWYRISDEVEYSTNFNFFIEHQVSVTQSGKEFKIFSTLDGKVLEEFNVYNRTNTIEDFDLKLKLKVLHQKILDGKIYEQKGVFTN